MLFREDEVTELKEQWTEDIKKEIVAFANSNGGTERDRSPYESLSCVMQNLTFESAQKEFELRKVEFGLQQKKTLKLMNPEGEYSNLGLLLSDQCTHTIKVAVFQGKDQMVFKDRREFGGSLLRQMNEVYDFIDFRNPVQSTIDKLVRIDTRDYPPTAIREALLNMLVHRDYSFSASALIGMYEDRMEFVSVGGLVPGIELEDVLLGISVCRNPDLANVFYRLRLIEAYGTGIGKIQKAYEGMAVQPVIETTKNAFKIILPNIHTVRDVKNDFGPTQGREETVMEFARANGVITKKNVMRMLGVSPATASRVLGDMVRHGKLSQNGKARSTTYTLKNAGKTGER